MRNELKDATEAIHDRIDHAVGALPLLSEKDYAAFLGAQYTARSIVERALAKQSPPEPGSPPSQLQALEADLADLGASPRSGETTIDLRNEYEALGAAWVLAGSSMGNRTILAQRRRAGLTNAERFLSDAAMPRYFKQLLRTMDSFNGQPMVDDAICGASKAFAVFETCFESIGLEKAA